MDEMQTNDDHKLAHARYRKLLMLMLGAFLISIVIAGIGGYLILVANDWSGIPRIFVIAPGLAALAVFLTPVYFIRKRWFPTRDSLINASTPGPGGP